MDQNLFQYKMDKNIALRKYCQQTSLQKKKINKKNKTNQQQIK